MRYVAIGTVLIASVMLAVAWLSLGREDPHEAPSVRVIDASAAVDGFLLGEYWTGSGPYTIEAAASAFSSTGDFQVFAARIAGPGIEETTLFWRADGRELGDGLIIGDTVTRRYSIWGEATAGGSPADRKVQNAKSSPEGEAVLDAVRR